MKLKKNTMYVIGLVAILAIAVFIFRDKIFGEKKPETALVVRGEYFRFRQNYANFAEFKIAFKNAVKQIIAAKGLSAKKAAVVNVKKIVNLFLDDYPALKTAILTITSLIVVQVTPFIRSKLDKLLFNSDGTLKTLAATMCKLGRSGDLIGELFNKYINEPIGSIIDGVLNNLNSNVVTKTALQAIELLGINIKSLLLDGIKMVAQDKIGDRLASVQDYVINKLEPALTTKLGKPISCSLEDPAKLNYTPEDMIVEEIDESDFADL